MSMPDSFILKHICVQSWVSFFSGEKTFNKVEVLIQEKIVDVDLQQKIWYVQGVLPGQ